VGFWTPEWARTINVPGFHLHFLSDDRTRAGHVIDIRAKDAVVELHAASDLHLVLPANEEFLRADLRGDPSAALAEAEGGSRARHR
jgi:acetolactate decarboxylase